MLADEVGLGKTIEAGLVLKELKARGMANRVLVLAPSGIVSQWQFELKTKFNEVFAHYNRATIDYLKGNHPGENVCGLIGLKAMLDVPGIIIDLHSDAWIEHRRPLFFRDGSRPDDCPAGCCSRITIRP